MKVIWSDVDDWHERQAYVKTLESLIALQKGIIPAQVVRFLEADRKNSIDEALASMSPEESRACRRKYRKLRRKILRNKKREMSKADIASQIFVDIRAEAHDAYDRQKKTIPS